MRRMNVQAVVQEVEQALHAVQADEVLVIEQEDGDNLVLIGHQHLLQLLGGQRNPDAIIRELTGGQRNPDVVVPKSADSQPI
jgi:hypothetical protein